VGASGSSIGAQASDGNAIAAIADHFPSRTRESAAFAWWVIDGIVGDSDGPLDGVRRGRSRLLIACANLANLMLTAQRADEKSLPCSWRSTVTGVCRSAGSGQRCWWRIGRILGVPVARWGVVGLVALAPQNCPESARSASMPPFCCFTGRVFAHGRALRCHPRFASASVDCGKPRGRAAAAPLANASAASLSAEVALAVVLLIVRRCWRSFANAAVAPDSIRHGSWRVSRYPRSDSTIETRSSRPAHSPGTVVVADRHAYGRDHALP
jgi:hypothetical protein